MRTNARLLAASFFGIALGVAQGAHAQQTESERLFNEGKAAFEAGNFAAACPKFEASYRKHEGVGTLLNLAACHEKEAKPWLAYNEYRLVETRAAAAGQGDRVNLARGRIAELEPQVARVQLSSASQQGVAQVLVDSEPMLGIVPTEAFAIRAPGRRILTISGPNRKPAAVEVDGEIGKLKIVDAPSGGPSEGAAGAAPAQSPGDKGDGGGGSKTLALAALGVGVVGIGVGSVFGIMTINKQSDIDSTARSSGCNVNDKTCGSPAALNKLKELHDQGSTDALVSTVGFIAGGVGIAAGVALLLLPSSGSVSASSAKTRISPTFGLNGGGIQLDQRF